MPEWIDKRLEFKYLKNKIRSIKVELKEASDERNFKRFNFLLRKKDRLVRRFNALKPFYEDNDD